MKITSFSSSACHPLEIRPLQLLVPSAFRLSCPSGLNFVCSLGAILFFIIFIFPVKAAYFVTCCEFFIISNYIFGSYQHTSFEDW
jgi:hypothetical protein